jgi:hypothetical protein
MKSYSGKLLEAGVMSNATLTSTPINIVDSYGVSITASYTGSPTGTLDLQVSNENSPIGSISEGSWEDVSLSADAVSSAGNTTWNIPGAYFRWARIKYTRTSGTGSLDVVFTAKGN